MAVMKREGWFARIAQNHRMITFDLSNIYVFFVNIKQYYTLTHKFIDFYTACCLIVFSKEYISAVKATLDRMYREMLDLT
ncbi:hypothetical protein C8N42_102135 [Celeribacter persicus]|uniref:Uncharacterized protein n=1 Tax=Celeribacter persicus TaxID=1651082 RepID=A0A2T5HUH8_9RHOB|nr:hypothetical protein C8N42_102135 [Celeribacter persicus]